MPLPLPNVEEFHVWLECGGKKMQEYDSQTLPRGIKSCWVASEAGKHFSIRIEIPPIAEGTIAARFYVDGVYLKTKHASSKPAQQLSYTLSTVRVGLTSSRSLCFSQITLTDDERFRDAAISTQLGTIEVKLRHVRLQRKTPYVLKIPIISNDPVHEQSKKGGGHRIQLGEESPSSSHVPKHSTSSEPFDPRNKGSFLSFRFQYRPADLLRAMDIIPPPNPEHNILLDSQGGKERGSDSQRTQTTSQNTSNAAVKVEVINSTSSQNGSLSVSSSSRLASAIDAKPESSDSRSPGSNDTLELAKLRERVARLQSDNSHLKKRLSKARGAKKANSVVKKENQRTVGLNSAISLAESDCAKIVIDLCSDD